MDVTHSHCRIQHSFVSSLFPLPVSLLVSRRTIRMTLCFQQIACHSPSTRTGLGSRRDLSLGLGRLFDETSKQQENVSYCIYGR